MVASLVATRVMFHWKKGRDQGGEGYLVTSAGGGCFGLLHNLRGPKIWGNVEMGFSLSVLGSHFPFFFLLT